MEQREEQQQGALQQAPPVLQRSAAWQQQQSQVHASEAMLGPSMSAQLRVLVVDSKAASRLNVTQLLSDCAYRVSSVRSTKEALQLLAPAASGAELPFDLILKEHEPPEVNACRLLRRLSRTELLAKIPVVLVSSNDEREVVMKCLTLGAIDYLIKPLRHNELRHIWTRVWWWRRSGMGGSEPHPLVNTDSMEFQISSEDSKETKCDDEDEPTSKEGSAPEDGNGSNGNGTSGHNHGSNGEGNGASGNGASRVEAKQHAGDGAGNGSSGNNDNSASKNGAHNNGSNGNGASTSLAEQNALLNTAEGKPPPNTEPLKVTVGRSFRPYNPEGSRKRPAAAAHGSDALHGSPADLHHHHHHHHHHHLAGSAENESNQGLMLNTSAQHHGGSTRSSGGYGGSRAAKSLSIWERDWDKGTNSSGPGSGVAAGAPPAAAEADLRNGQLAPGVVAMPLGVGPLLIGSSVGGGSTLQPSMHAGSDDTVTVDLPGTQSQQPVGVTSGINGVGVLAHRAVGSSGGGGASGHPMEGGGSGMAATTQLRLGSSLGASLGPGAGSADPGGSCSVPEHGANGSMRQSSGMMGQSALAGPGVAAVHGHMDPAVAASMATLAAQHMSQGQVAAGSAQGPAGSSAAAGPALSQPAMALPGAWGAQAAALQGSMHHGQAAGGYPQGYGGMYPGTGMPYNPVMGMPPHMLHQLHPQMLQALFAANAAGHAHPHAHPHAHMQPVQGVEPMQSALAAAAMYHSLPALYHMPPAMAAWQQQQLAMGQAQQAVPMYMPPCGLGAAPMAPDHQHAQSKMPDVYRMAGAPVGQPQPQPLLAAVKAGQVGAHMPTSIAAPPAVQPVGAAQAQDSLGGAAQMDALGAGANLAQVLRLPLPEKRKRRAAALAKYRKKRQNLKFGKTIRYESRKQLAHQRPRVKGQFVKQGTDVAGAGARAGAAAGGEVAGVEEDTQDEEEAEYERKGAVGGGRSGFGGQNFDEEGEYDRNPEDDAMEEDSEGSEGGGGSGTDAGDGLQRAAQRPPCEKTPESEDGEPPLELEEGPVGEDVAEDEDDVVNSLRKLREGPPRVGRGSKKHAAAAPDVAAGQLAPGSAAAAGVASVGPKASAALASPGAPTAGAFGLAPFESHGLQNLNGNRGGPGEPHGAGHGGAGGGGSALARLVLTRGSGQKLATVLPPGHSPDAGGSAGGTGQAATTALGSGVSIPPHRSHGGGGREGGNNNKNGSDSGSNSPDENGGNRHSKGAANVVSSHGSGDGGSGHQSRGGSHETSGHGSVADTSQGQAGAGTPGPASRHDKR